MNLIDRDLDNEDDVTRKKNLSEFIDLNHISAESIYCSIGKKFKRSTEIAVLNTIENEISFEEFFRLEILRRIEMFLFLWKLNFRGPQKTDLLELLTQIRQGKVSSNVFVRLERLQVRNERKVFEQSRKVSKLNFRPQFQTPVSNISISSTNWLFRHSIGNPSRWTNKKQQEKLGNTNRWPT